MPTHGNVRKLASNEQFDELRICLEKSFNKLRGRMDADIAQGWIGNSGSLDDGVERLLLPPEMNTATGDSKPRIHFRERYVGKRILIDATDGKRTIAKAKNVFVNHIDDNFAEWCFDTPGVQQGLVRVSIHERCGINETLRGIFESFGRNLIFLHFTQHQIIEFCRKHRDKLSYGTHGTFFLIRINDGEYFVVNVIRNPNRHLSVFLYSDSHYYAGWDNQPLHFVLPHVEQ